MSTITRNREKLLESVMERCLGSGVDTPRLDEFLDHLLRLAGELGSLSCTLADTNTLGIQSGDTLLHEREILRAKTKLRMLCARLAVRCGEWSGRNVSPYGDVIECQIPESNGQCKIRFENTPVTQKIEFEVDSAVRNNDPPRMPK